MKNQQKNYFTAVRLQGYVESFIKSLRSNSTETRGTYDRSLREFLRWIESDKKFSFTMDDIIRYKKYLTTVRMLSPVSISTYLTAVRRLCHFLMEQNILPSNPAASVKGNPRPSHHTREILDAKSIRLLMQTVERLDERGYRDFALLKLMAVCGLSEIELTRADIGDLQQKATRRIMYTQGKGEKNKKSFIPLPDDVRHAIEAYLCYRKEASPEEPLFLSAGNRTRGERMTTRGIRERINLYLEKSGLKKGKARTLTPFSLRHSAAQIDVSRGMSLQELRDKFRIGSDATAKLYLDHKN